MWSLGTGVSGLGFGEVLDVELERLDRLGFWGARYASDYYRH